MRNASSFMLADVQSMLDKQKSRDLAVGVAGVWSEVTKSIDRRLHSQIEQQLTALLLGGDEAVRQARILVGRLLVTSLVHHGHSAHIVPLFELLIQWCKDEEEEALTWLSAAVGTRKGNRVDDSVKPALFELLLNLAEQRGQELPIVTLLSLALPVGRIPDLVGAGIKIIDALRNSEGGTSPAFSSLVLALASPVVA